MLWVVCLSREMFQGRWTGGWWGAVVNILKDLLALEGRRSTRGILWFHRVPLYVESLPRTHALQRIRHHVPIEIRARTTPHRWVLIMSYWLLCLRFVGRRCLICLARMLELQAMRRSRCLPARLRVLWLTDCWLHVLLSHSQLLQLVHVRWVALTWRWLVVRLLVGLIRCGLDTRLVGRRVLALKGHVLVLGDGGLVLVARSPVGGWWGWLGLSLGGDSSDRMSARGDRLIRWWLTWLVLRRYLACRIVGGLSIRIRDGSLCILRDRILRSRLVHPV